MSSTISLQEMDCLTPDTNLTPINQIANKVPGEPAFVVNGLPIVNRVLDSTSQLDPMNKQESDVKSDHHFGKWMEGREVKKMFEDTYYVGKVVKYDRKMNWYRVVYEDGDFEDLDWHELEEVLVSIDISYPLKKLAKKLIKNGRSAEYKGITGKQREQEGRFKECPQKKTKRLKGASKLKGNRKRS